MAAKIGRNARSIDAAEWTRDYSFAANAMIFLAKS